MDKTLIEAIGLTQEEIATRVIEKIAEQIMSETGCDEDGNESRFRSTVARKLTEKVTESIDATVSRIGAEILAPSVEEMVRSLVIQKTNEWGEKRGEPVSFVQYLTQRADEFLREEVNHDGKSKTESGDGYNWRASTTRVTGMIDKYLKYEIEQFARQSLVAANAAIAEGIAAAVKGTMQKLINGVKVSAVVPERP